MRFLNLSRSFIFCNSAGSLLKQHFFHHTTCLRVRNKPEINNENCMFNIKIRFWNEKQAFYWDNFMEFLLHVFPPTTKATLCLLWSGLAWHGMMTECPVVFSCYAPLIIPTDQARPDQTRQCRDFPFQCYSFIIHTFFIHHCSHCALLIYRNTYTLWYISIFFQSSLHSPFPHLI